MIVAAATSTVLPVGQPGAAQHAKARRPRPHSQLLAERVGLGGTEDDALLRRAADVLGRRADDEQDEAVQEDEEHDLEDKECLVGCERQERHGSDRPKTISVDPSVILSPSRSRSRSTCLPFTAVPFVESRSTIQYVAPSWRSSACRRDTLTSGTGTSHAARASEDDPRLRDLVRGAGHRQRHDLPLGRRRRRFLGVGRDDRRGLVDHRLRGLLERELRGRGFRFRVRGRLRLNEAGGDSELADGEVLVGGHEHDRRGEERVALAARMLGEVLLELGHERLLVPGELLSVLRREVDRELVRDVDPRHGDGAVIVHLLHELARELDRLDMRAEGAPEDALEETFDLGLDRAQH